MRLLLTNDDGYQSPGLVALFRALHQRYDVSTVAPIVERSTCGHSATLSGPMAVRRLDHAEMGRLYAVEGTPADCVRLAFTELLDEKPQVVVSGINVGANVSIVDVNCSGTVAAAREGVFCGAAGIAVSQLFLKSRPLDWERATLLVGRLLPQLIDQQHGVMLWNVSLPALSPDDPTPAVRVVPLSTDQIPLVFSSQMGSAADRPVFEYAGFYARRRNTPGTDVAAVFEGAIAVTPLLVDSTDHPSLSRGFQFHI